MDRNIAVTLLFRRAAATDHGAIWSILQGAIARRAKDGSTQWQNGYPNADVVSSDIARGIAFVVVDSDNTVVGCCAVIDNDEPAYADIRGAWLSDGEFVVVHRIAVAEQWLGRGVAQAIMAHVEDLARGRAIPAVRVDTNYDNVGMLRVFEKRGYAYCGEVLMSGSPRRAFEKRLP